MSYSHFKAAQHERFNREGNFITLDRCGCRIWADPNWNDYALAHAIKKHYKTSCYMKEDQES